MNPKFKDLLKSTVVFTSGSTAYALVCSEYRRGSGRDMFCLDIGGLTHGTLDSTKQYQVEFCGQQWMATLRVIGTVKEFSKVRLRTIVSAPEFWE